MKVINWVSYSDEILEKYRENSIGGLGGFFNFQSSGMRWKNYIENFTDEEKLYVESLRYEIVNKNLKFSGAEHQNPNNENVPLFEDNTIATYSYRAWGDLMAAIWSEQENKDYCYIDFYM